MGQRRTIFINGRFLTRPMTGVDRFAHEILLELDQWLASQADTAPEVVVLTPKAVSAPPYRAIRLQTTGPGQGHLWEQVSLPLLTWGRPLLSLCNTGPMLKRRHLVVIHDATTVRAPESYSKAFRLWYGILMPILGRMASRIVTVSEFARQDIAQAFGIPDAKIRTVGEGGQHMLRYGEDETPLDRLGLRGKPYFLAVSSQAPHKNFKLLLDAIGDNPDLPYDVVIAGGHNPRVFGQARLTQHPRVHFVGYVSNEALKSLYRHATAFVFPSLQEGFGLPLVEAMVLDCPVIASNAASIPEVCGDAALYVDPHDAQALRRTMDQVARDPQLRARMVTAARLRSKQWTWQKASQQLAALMELP